MIDFDTVIEWTIGLPWTLSFRALDATPEWFQDSPILVAAAIVLLLPVLVPAMLIGFFVMALLMLACVPAAPFVLAYKLIRGRK